MGEGRGPTYCSNELHLDARVLQALAILGPDGNSSLHRLSVRIQRAFLFSVLVELDVDHLPLVIGIIETDIDIEGGGEEVRHGGTGRREWAAR